MGDGLRCLEISGGGGVDGCDDFDIFGGGGALTISTENRTKDILLAYKYELIQLYMYICIVVFHTIAVIVLAFFPPVLLVMPVLLRFLAVGRVAPRATAVTLLLSIARFFGFVTFIRTHVGALDLMHLWKLKNYLLITL